MIKLSATIPAALVEPLEDHFCEALSSWTIVHPRPEDSVTLSGYFDNEPEGRQAWAALSAVFAELPPEPVAEVVRDEDWMEAYKHHLKPWACGRLQWIPEWERETHPVPQGSAAVYLDSGLAFGTGSHETTRLCARALVRFADERGANGSVIDAGCGSGVLALSAARLGFPDVTAFDNDPEAVRVTRENAASNGLADGLKILEAGVQEGLKGRTVDLLLANIQSNILCLYAEELLGAVAPGGWLALSGILSREAEETAAAFAGKTAESWGRNASPEIENDGEWSLVLLRREENGKPNP